MFKNNVTKAMKCFEDILTKLQGQAPPRTLVETAKEDKKAEEVEWAATDKNKDFVSKVAAKQQQQFL